MTKENEFPDPQAYLAEQFARLAPVFDDAVQVGAPGWAFFLLCLEFDGDEMRFVTSAEDQALWITAISDEANSLERRDPIEGVTVDIRLVDCAEGTLDSRRRAFLIELAPRLSNVALNAGPPGWGFALLIFDPKSNEKIYCSNCEREGMVEAFRELVTKAAAGEVDFHTDKT